MGKAVYHSLVRKILLDWLTILSFTWIIRIIRILYQVFKYNKKIYDPTDHKQICKIRVPRQLECGEETDDSQHRERSVESDLP